MSDLQEDNQEQERLFSGIIENFLQSASPQIAELIRLGAIPHWLDDDLLKSLLAETEIAPEVLEQFLKLSFIRKNQQGRLLYHDQIRKYLLAWWKSNRLQQSQNINHKLSSYFITLAQAGSPGEQTQYEVEAFYHLLQANEEQGLDELRKNYEKYCQRYQLDLAERLVQYTRELKGLMSAQGDAWASYFEGRMNLLYRRSDQGEGIFQTLKVYDADQVLQAAASWSLGDIRLNQYRWSEAINLYHDSLKILRIYQDTPYLTQVMLALGRAYVNLADCSGGLSQSRLSFPNKLSRYLYTIQHLPYLLYERLVRRVDFLPNWYFGTNFQDWIIYYLLTEAENWFTQAETHQNQNHDWPEPAVVIQLSLAELEHQLGRWSKAHRRYIHLLASPIVTNSSYKLAWAKLGLGRSLYVEGKLKGAQDNLVDAIDILRSFGDNRRIGVAATFLAYIYEETGKVDLAVATYIESARAYLSSQEYIAYTHSMARMKDLAHNHTLSAPSATQVRLEIEQATERHHLTRFPGATLKRFRQLGVALMPLTYFTVFIITLISMLIPWFIEGGMGLWQQGNSLWSAVVEGLLTLLIITFGTVAFTLWFYRFIYTLIGIIIVRVLGKRLVNIENDQPDYVIVNDNGLIYRPKNNEALQMSVNWSAISRVGWVNYCIWRLSVGLFSSTIISIKEGLLLLSALTSDYTSLKDEIKRHLQTQQSRDAIPSFDFVIFNPRWLSAITAIALVSGLVARQWIKITRALTPSGEYLIVNTTTIVSLASITALLLFPTVTLWRLFFHQKNIQKKLLYRSEAVPLWSILLITIFVTLISSAWIIFLFVIAPYRK